MPLAVEGTDDRQTGQDLAADEVDIVHAPVSYTHLDTKGPEYRIGTFEDGKITLDIGDTFTFTTEPVAGSNERVSVSYPGPVSYTHLDVYKRQAMSISRGTASTLS